MRAGSPFKFFVDTIGNGAVTAYGAGLTNGVCGVLCNFTISTKASSKDLLVTIEGPNKQRTESNFTDNKDGTVTVSYLPLTPGEYKVVVQYGNKQINGSPYMVKISGEGRRRSQKSVGFNSEVALPTVVSEADIRSLNASIQAMSGFEEPCFVKLIGGKLGRNSPLHCVPYPYPFFFLYKL